MGTSMNMRVTVKEEGLHIHTHTHTLCHVSEDTILSLLEACFNLRHFSHMAKYLKLQKSCAHVCKASLVLDMFLRELDAELKAEVWYSGVNRYQGRTPCVGLGDRTVGQL